MTATPRPQHEPRFPNVSRRAFLRRSAFVGLATAAVPALAACGGSSTTSPATNARGTTGVGSASTDAATITPGSTANPATTVTADDTTVAAEPATTTGGQAFGSGAQMQVNFTYQASGGGRVHSPYIAVWIEDPAGDLVQTVSLWYKSDESKYLNDLKRWSSKNNSNAMTTGATRIPGAFSVAWNGSNLGGAEVADGEYFVCIEAAREDGPYQIIREAVAVSGSLSPTTLTPSGELTAASVELVA